MAPSADRATVARFAQTRPNRRRADPRLRHDAHQALATIALLIEAIRSEDELLPRSGHRLELVHKEAQRLTDLVSSGDMTASAPVRDTVMLDVLANEVVAVVDDTTSATVRCSVEQVSVSASATGLWRVLHNIVSNAVRAVGADGNVQVQVARRGLSAVIEVDDNGPGFPYGPPGAASQGLGVVQNFLEVYGGTLEIGRGALGGCLVRLRLPAAAEVRRADLVPEPRHDQLDRL